MNHLARAHGAGGCPPRLTNSINKSSGPSAVAMPVGRWFDIEMHYVWTDTPNGTVTLWIDGQQALQQTGVQTRESSHQIVETYLKFHGSTQGRGSWTPTPSLKYTRNVRVAGERIWRVPAPKLSPCPNPGLPSLEVIGSRGPGNLVSAVVCRVLSALR